MYCLTAWGQWAVELLLCTASLPWGSGQWSSRRTLPHCLGAVGSGTRVVHRLTAWGQSTLGLIELMVPVHKRTGASLNLWPLSRYALGPH